MDLQSIINVVAGIALSAIGWFARQLWDAVQKLRADLHKLELELPKHYVHKDQFAEAMKEFRSELTKGFDRIYDKLDGKADK